MKRHKFEEIKQFRPRTWRYGKGKDKAYRRYYLAKLAGDKCFIKIAENDETVKNEIKMQKYLNSEKFKYTPEYKKADKFFSDTQVMLAISFIEDLHQIKTPTNERSLELICKEFINICDYLFNKQIIHADIHKGNLLQKKDGSLVILDFGISMASSVENTVDYVARPGTFFVENRNIREYDDVYSFLKMLDSVGIDEELKYTAPYKKIVSLLGRYSKKIDLNDYRKNYS
ncbi:protein kinase domain-containing protein [Natronospora cellulosivora (SeqCode)]